MNLISVVRSVPSGCLSPERSAATRTRTLLHVPPSYAVDESVQAVINNAPNLTPAAATRAIPAASAQGINTGTGETDVGTAIDRAAGYNNPIYPVASTASTSLADTNTSPGWGQNGWRYTDAAGTLQTQDAKLIDAPRRANAATNARHIFEATATATKGTQAGVYYGSVRWGWRTDSTGDTVMRSSVSNVRRYAIQ